MQKKDYVNNLFDYYEREKHQKRAKNYLKNHAFTLQNRSVLIDWMLACIDYYRVSLQVFYTAVYYLDIYLSSKDTQQVNRSKLQCVGAACIWLSLIQLSQDEDVVAHFLDMIMTVDPESNAKLLFKTLTLIIQRFSHKPYLITSYHFLLSYIYILDLEPRHNLNWMSHYILELSLYDDDISLKNKFAPSLIATAAVYTGLVALKLTEQWVPDLTILTWYTGLEPGLIHIHQRMLTLIKTASPSKYGAVYIRYSRREFNFVALVDFSFIP
ncbi:cyclin-B2-1-like [Argonauta hians]